MIKFKTGETYSARSICDYDCVFSFTILSRTAKTVTIEKHGRITKRGVKHSEYDNCEMCYPLGSYSMAPTIYANKPAA